MSDQDAFLASIIENPADYAPRGVFADWLEEHGDERFDVIRRGTVGEAVAAFARHVITEQNPGISRWVGRRDVGPWVWSGAVFAHRGWLPAVSVGPPLTLTRLLVSYPDGAVTPLDLLVRTPTLSVNQWSLSPRTAFETPIPPLSDGPVWILLRGDTQVYFVLTIEHRASPRYAHLAPRPAMR